MRGDTALSGLGRAAHTGPSPCPTKLRTSAAASSTGDERPRHAGDERGSMRAGAVEARPSKFAISLGRADGPVCAARPSR